MISINFIWETIKRIINPNNIEVDGELTDWYPSDVRPVREGIYQVRTDDEMDVVFAYFDGVHWVDKDNHEFSYFFQNREWRGLAHEPK